MWEGERCSPYSPPGHPPAESGAARGPDADPRCCFTPLGFPTSAPPCTAPCAHPHGSRCAPSPGDVPSFILAFSSVLSPVASSCSAQWGATTIAHPPPGPSSGSGCPRKAGEELGRAQTAASAPSLAGGGLHNTWGEVRSSPPMKIARFFHNWQRVLHRSPCPAAAESPGPSGSGLQGRRDVRKGSGACFPG